MKKVSLTTWILLATLLGIALGSFAPGFAVQLQFISNIFIRLIKSIIAPLIFSSLVYGIAKSGTAGTMGRVGAKAMSYFSAATSMALLIGLVMVNVFRPGAGVVAGTGSAITSPVPAHLTFSETIERMFPRSIVESMANGDVLPIVIFSILFGMACSAVGVKAEPVVRCCGALMEVMFKYTQYVTCLAPFGAGAAIAVTVGKNGPGALAGPARLVGTLYLALIVFVVFVLGPVVMVARIPLRRFFAATRQPFILAFSTASSEAALPQALENMERFGIPKHIVNFVLPLGYSFNMDGSTLYLALASVFVAQTAGIELSIGTQTVMMLTLMLTSKGTAAVPRASFAILAGTAASFNLPMEGISLILGVDAFMDMARTSVNLLGNCLASAVVARWEGVDLNQMAVAEAQVAA